MWTYFYPLRAYAADAIRSARLPLWNPDTFLGAPFLANPQTAILYPGSVLFYLLPVPYAYSLSIIVHVWLLAILTYAFLRRVFEVGTAGALVGAAAFAYGGFVSAQVGHINQLSATAWLPAVALAADQTIRRPNLRWAVAGAAALAMQLLAGHAQETYMTLWTALVVVGWRVLSSGPRMARGLPYGLVLGGLGFGLAAAQLLPTAELSAQGIRAGGLTYEEGVSFSLLPTVLVRSLLPGYWYNLFSEYIGYVGGIGLAFAVLALLSSRSKATAGAAALAAVGLFFALGGANPLYGLLFYRLPGLDLFRVPARWLCVYSFGAASLAALGVDWALTARSRAGPTRPRTAAMGSGWLRAGAGALALLIVVGLAWVSVAGTVPGRIIALWLAALLGGGILALLARRWPSRVVAGVLVAATLVELRAAALDLPVRHAVPAEAAEGPRPVPTHLAASPAGGRLLSIAPTEYQSAEDVALGARYPQLSPTAAFNLRSAVKLDEVMSPNVPLRFGLSTADGYDGGVLPLRRYLEVASLLVPASELRSDGVLRTRLIAIPEQRYVELFGVTAVVANQVIDRTVDGVHYEVATARTLEPGQSLRIELPQPVSLDAVALLGSLTDLPPGATPEGSLVVVGADGSRTPLPLRLGRELFTEQEPGPSNAPQPTAGLSREGRADTAVRFALPTPVAAAALEWQWPGPGSWSLRAATLVLPGGEARPVMLQPGWRLTRFPILEVFERDPGADPAGPGRVRLVPGAEIGDDRAALAFLRTGDNQRVRDTVILAPETVGAARLPADAGSSPAAGGPAIFERTGGPPERLTYQRADPGGVAGYLLVNDGWFPGWRAEIDGREVPVYRADVHFKAVWVPAGARTVVLTYEPRSVRLGALVSLLSLVVGAALLVLPGRVRWPGRSRMIGRA